MNHDHPHFVNQRGLRVDIMPSHTLNNHFKIGIRLIRVSKDAKIRNRYNQVPHLTQDTNGKVTNSQFRLAFLHTLCRPIIQSSRNLQNWCRIIPYFRFKCVRKCVFAYMVASTSYAPDNQPSLPRRDDCKNLYRKGTIFYKNYTAKQVSNTEHTHSMGAITNNETTTTKTEPLP